MSMEVYFYVHKARREQNETGGKKRYCEYEMRVMTGWERREEELLTLIVIETFSEEQLMASHIQNRDTARKGFKSEVLLLK